MEDKLLTRSEAQQVLRVGSCKIFQMIRSGEIPAIKIGRVYRIKQSDLENYLQKQKNQNGESL